MFHLAVAALLGAASLFVSSGNDGQRAVAAYRSMQAHLYDRASGEYREEVGARPGAHAWPLSQALAGTIAVSTLAHVRPEVAKRLEPLRAGTVYAASPGGAVYWDDNEWIAQDFLALGDPLSVARARAIFAGVVGAWDGDPTKPCAGGVQWTDAPGNDDRNTVSTVNGALVGLELYAARPDPQLLAWSEKMLDWTETCMLGPDGLFADHIGGDGSVDQTVWSYNQGSLIGALVLLARETGDPAAFAQAEGIADRAIAYFQGRWLTQEPPEFAAIFFRNLLLLATADHRLDYLAAAQSYADAMWAKDRDPKTGLVSTQLLGQAAMVQLYADLARAAAVVPGDAEAAPS